MERYTITGLVDKPVKRLRTNHDEGVESRTKKSAQDMDDSVI